MLKAKKRSPQNESVDLTADLSDFELISLASKSSDGAMFGHLISGDWSDHYDSQSDAEFAFCAFLARFTNSPIAIDRCYRNSKLKRTKWDERHGSQTYGERTIAKVLETASKESKYLTSKDSTQLETAQAVIKMLGRKNIIFHARQFWIWDQTGKWCDCAEEEIKQHIHKVSFQKTISQSRVNSILGLLKTEVFIAKHSFSKDNYRIINCLNAELHFEGQEFVEKPHNSENLFIHQIPVVFNKKARCKLFIKTLQEIFANDLDATDRIKLVQEFLGYSLTTSCEFERLLMFLGDGSNGKSVILSVIICLLGKDNVAAIQPDQFDDRFAMAHLQGKLANIITEIPQGSVVSDAKLKALVSGERMTVQHKYGKLFDLEPYATMILATNHLPHTKDTSPAFFRRFEILTFNRQFTEEDKNPNLKRDLQEELPGILNFALEGLKRLYETGDFTQVQCSLDTKMEWEVSADQVKAFVRDECVLEAGATTSISELYIRYQNWADEYGLKTVVNKNTLTKRLLSMRCERKRGSQGTHMIAGVKLR